MAKTKYYYCTYKYYLKASAIPQTNGATNSGMGQLCVSGPDPNPIDTIKQVLELRPECEMVMPVLFKRITHSQYKAWLNLSKKAN